MPFFLQEAHDFTFLPLLVADLLTYYAASRRPARRQSFAATQTGAKTEPAHRHRKNRHYEPLPGSKSEC